MYGSSRRFAVLSLGVALAAACQDVTRPIVPIPSDDPLPSADASRAAVQAVERPHEAEFHRLSREIDGFGGHFFDEEGNLVVYLKDPAVQGRARAALASVLTAREELAEVAGAQGDRPLPRPTGSILVRKADFTFQELAAWRDRATDQVLNDGDVVFTDLDEAQNRFVVGVSSGRGRLAAARVLRAAGVPAEAVVYTEATPAVEFAHTLQHYYRPLQGGYQIEFPTSATTRGRCTLGFNAFWNGQTTVLTNSHCTERFWAFDGRPFYQNTIAAANLVGSEIHDPAPQPCGFLNLYLCRWSDAAVVRRNAGVPWDYGYIARTTFWATGAGVSGSLVVDHNNPRMRIIAEQPRPSVGQLLDKMGRTTGWTYGTVRRTCVDHSKGGNLILRCQDWIRDMHATFGDSGSPIFRWHGSTVTLAGLLWGGTTSEGVPYTLMSAMQNIEADLGPLATF